MSSHITKIILFVLLLLLKTSICQSSSHYYLLKNPHLQIENKIDELKQFDYSMLFSDDHALFNIGYIGEKFSRIRIIFISVIKNPLNQQIYYVYGKSNVQNNICEFQGTIEIREIRILCKMHYGVDDIYKDKGIISQGVLIANYNFYENIEQSNSGYFSGELYSGWYLNNEKRILYDDIEIHSDRWCNNQFIGQWKSYTSNKSEACNWGHGHIPYSSELDQGVGEFYPNKKYWDQGWDIFYKAWIEYPKTEDSKNERIHEIIEWWK